MKRNNSSIVIGWIKYISRIILAVGWRKSIFITDAGLIINAGLYLKNTAAAALVAFGVAMGIANAQENPDKLLWGDTLLHPSCNWVRHEFPIRIILPV
jgi:hypothetical protein